MRYLQRELLWRGYGTLERFLGQYEFFRMRKESILYGASSLVRPVKLIEYAADPPGPLDSRTEPAIFTVFGNDAVYMAITGLFITIGAGVGAFFGGAAAVCAPTSARP